jgi:hypothetical protein
MNGDPFLTGVDSEPDSDSDVEKDRAQFVHKGYFGAFQRGKLARVFCVVSAFAEPKRRSAGLHPDGESIESTSRPTVVSHLGAMQIAHAMHLVFPIHSGGKREIVARPKCYAFDTGFVSF